jgi:hypothetical protein
VLERLQSHIDKGKSQSGRLEDDFGGRLPASARDCETNFAAAAKLSC